MVITSVKNRPAVLMNIANFKVSISDLRFPMIYFFPKKFFIYFRHNEGDRKQCLFIHSIFKCIHVSGQEPETLATRFPV